MTPVYQSNGQPTNSGDYEIQLERPKARTPPITREDQPTYQGLLDENSEFLSMIIAINLDCQENGNIKNKIMSHLIFHEYMK